MRIGELARTAGTTTRALRYYESQGLLAAPRRANGYREYDESHLRLVREIQALQAVGFALEETRPFVDCLLAGNESGDSCPDSVAVLRRKLAEVDACMARLAEVRRELAGKLANARDLQGADMSTEPVTDATFADRVLRHDKPVLVDFWAAWCPPCRMIDPVLAEIADERAGSLTIVKINYDENPATGRKYGVMGLPTMLLFRDGEPIRSFVGARPKARLLAELDDALRPPVMG